jgi:hypothetical protein
MRSMSAAFVRERPVSGRRSLALLLASVLAFLLASCAAPRTANPERIAVRMAQVYGPQCLAEGPTNTQAWGYCIARTYDRAVAQHGGACSSWQLRGAASYEDCVLDASPRPSAVSAVGAGPFCIGLNAGGDVNFAACK